MNLYEKKASLEELFLEMGSVLVAYSGGVDSSYLAAVAHDVLGDKAVAVTGLSPTYTDTEVREAKELMARLGMRHILVPIAQMANPGFVENEGMRCYFCRQQLFGELKPLSRKEGLSWIIDGINVDDVGDFRPGRKAGKELGVRSPLLEVGFTKEEVRALSKERELPTWDKPGESCLASRIPYGTPITVEALTRIGKAEEYLHSLGIGQLRVRHHNTIARIEVLSQDLPRFLEPGVREKVVEHLRSLGFVYVTLDLMGYRSGSLNQELKHRKKQSSLE